MKSTWRSRMDFPGDPVVESLPVTVGNTERSHMLQGEEIRVPQLLSPHTPEPVLCNRRSHYEEKLQSGPTHHNQRKPITATKTRCSHKQMKFTFLKMYLPYRRSPINSIFYFPCSLFNLHLSSVNIYSENELFSLRLNSWFGRNYDSLSPCLLFLFSNAYLVLLICFTPKKWVRGRMRSGIQIS